MPPVVAVVAAAWTAIGAAAAGTGIAALAANAFIGAVYGAAIGAATSAITGGSISKGALKGAMMGAVGGAVVKGVSMGAEAAKGATAAKTATTAATSGTGAVTEGLQAANTANQIEANALMNAGNAGATTGKAATGILSKAGNWMEANPVKAGIIGNTVAGAATSMLQAKQQEDEMKSLLKANTVTGLTELDLKNTLPSIKSFADTPKWRMPDGEAGLNTATAK